MFTVIKEAINDLASDDFHHMNATSTVNKEPIDERYHDIRTIKNEPIYILDDYRMNVTFTVKKEPGDDNDDDLNGTMKVFCHSFESD